MSALAVSCTVLVVVVVAGCGSGVQAGLSNAPSLQRPTRSTQPHDVVANGNESCAPSGAATADPLKNRIPRCAETGNTRRTRP